MNADTMNHIARVITLIYPSWRNEESDFYTFLYALSQGSVSMKGLRELVPHKKWTKHQILHAINPIMNRYSYNIVATGRGSDTVFSLEDLNDRT